MTDKYILRGHEVIPEEDLLTWARWLETSFDERRVAQEQIGDYEVLTIFLGLDHNWARMRNPELPPLVFETMVFSGFNRQGVKLAQKRCSTWAEAEEQHRKLAEKFRQAVNS